MDSWIWNVSWLTYQLVRISWRLVTTQVKGWHIVWYILYRTKYSLSDSNRYPSKEQILRLPCLPFHQVSYYFLSCDIMWHNGSCRLMWFHDVTYQKVSLFLQSKKSFFKFLNLFNWNMTNPNKATPSQHKVNTTANADWADTSGGDTRAANRRDANKTTLRLSVRRRGLITPRWKETPNSSGNCKMAIANRAILRLRSMYGPILACNWIDTTGSATSKVSKIDAACGRTTLYAPPTARAAKQLHNKQNTPHLSLSKGKQPGAIKHHVW